MINLRKTPLIIVAIAIASVVLNACIPQQKKEEKYVSLMKTRLNHKPKFTIQSSAPKPFSNTTPPGAQLIHYQSGKLSLKGYLFRPNAKEEKSKAVLYGHSSYAFDKYDAEAIKPFLQYGYVVFVPTFRGENGNPGSFEQCYGEVMDALNALNWLSTRPEVESSEIYGAGNGVGGTIIWLLAELSPKMKKAAVFGPFPSMLKDQSTYPEPPFNRNRADELKVRSPGEFLPDLKCPLLALFAANDPQDEKYKNQLKGILDNYNAKAEEPAEIEIVEVLGADHNKRIDGAISRMLTFFNTK